MRLSLRITLHCKSSALMKRSSLRMGEAYYFHFYDSCYTHVYLGQTLYWDFFFLQEVYKKEVDQVLNFMICVVSEKIDFI